VGLRALETLVDPALSAWSPQQSTAFRLVDVLLTGAVIARGSEGIHHLATVFENFMATAAARGKGCRGWPPGPRSSRAAADRRRPGRGREGLRGWRGRGHPRARARRGGRRGVGTAGA
jgi:hypothetical protein